MFKTIYNIKETVKPLVFGNAHGFSKPVFILSAPRSGSTHLYEILRRCSNVISLDQENDSFWWSMFPYSRLDPPNDFIHSCEVDTDYAKKVRAALCHHLTHTLFNKNFTKFLKLRFHSGKLIYLEKTIANCFHLEALTILFPDARFIYLFRDGRATISSMIEGWNAGRFMKRILPFSDNSSIDYWTYPIPPGWEKKAHKKLNEICAWSWLQHNKCVLDFFETTPVLQKNLVRVSYENLVTKPDKTINALISFCDFRKSRQVDSYLHDNLPSRTTISKPKNIKWQHSNVEDIMEIENLIAPMMARLGYPGVLA